MWDPTNILLGSSHISPLTSSPTSHYCFLSDPCPCWPCPCSTPIPGPLPPAPLTVTALLSLQVKASAAQEGDPLAPRWRAVGLLQEQWSGLVEGYQARARAEGSSPATVNGSNTVGDGG